MKTFDDLNDTLIPEIECSLQRTYSGVSLWYANSEDNINKLTIVINTFGALKLSVVNLAIWKHGYTVTDVAISHIGDEDSVGFTNVTLSLERL